MKRKFIKLITVESPRRPMVSPIWPVRPQGWVFCEIDPEANDWSPRSWGPSNPGHLTTGKVAYGLYYKTLRNLQNARNVVEFSNKGTYIYQYACRLRVAMHRNMEMPQLISKFRVKGTHICQYAHRSNITMRRNMGIRFTRMNVSQGNRLLGLPRTVYER